MSTSPLQPKAREPQRAPQLPPIRKATRDDLPEIAASLARAYYDDPVWSFLVPDDERRQQALTRYFTIEVRDVVLPHDTAWTPGASFGAILTLPPGHWKLSPLTMARRGPAFLQAFGPDLPRALRALALLDRVHPRAPHYFIAYAGLAPDRQGKGVGSALVAPLLERADAEHAPIYLEATSERAAAFYGRQGFEVTQEIKLNNGPPLWLMWREWGGSS